MKRTKAASGLALPALLVPALGMTGHFGEGYSSSVPGGPADLRYRAFTIYTAQDACARSPHPDRLQVRPEPLVLKVGDRLHRSNVEHRVSELIIEAYGADGEFLSAVPIIVSTSDRQNVTMARSDWDYLEAVREGEDELVVAWACPTPDGLPLEKRVRLSVRAGDGRAD